MSGPTKKRHYERMMERMTRAIQNEAYLEAILYAYALLEDRMVAILHRSGGAHLKKTPNKLIQNFGAKLDVIKTRRVRDSLLRVYFTDDFIRALKKWKDARNALTHAMADATVPLEDIDTQAHDLAVEGRELVREMCRNQRRLQRNRHKLPIPARPFPY